MTKQLMVGHAVNSKFNCFLRRPQTLSANDSTTRTPLTRIVTAMHFVLQLNFCSIQSINGCIFKSINNQVLVSFFKVI